MNIHFIQHVAFEHPGYLLQWAKENDHTISFTKLYDSIVFPTLDSFQMLVIMGGPMGVYEEEKYPWLKDEKSFIRTAIDAKKKVLGICLGSQLIAEVLGSQVYQHTAKEIGWWPVQKIAAHKLTENLSQEFTTFHWHGDTFQLPANCQQLFTSRACNQQGFIYNNHVAALQFHMEVMEDLLNNMILHEKHEIVANTFVQTEQTINNLLPEFVSLQNQYMHYFMDAFIAL